MSTKGYISESVVQTSKPLPLMMEGLTPEMVRKAEEELHETPESKQEALKEMRRLIYAEKDFRPIMDDQFLTRFLRAKKFDPEVAIKTLKNYYTYKVRYSRILTDMLPSELEHVLDLNWIAMATHRDTEGSVVAMAKLGTMDLTKATLEELVATALLAAEIFLQSEATQICGVVLVADLKGLSLRLIRHFASPTLLYRLVRALQDCMPVRIKALHVVHEPFYFSMVFNILKKILSEKMRKRFQFHGNNYDNLHKQIPREILPKEFGGLQGPMNSEILVKELSGKDKHFSKMAKYGYQEKRAQFIKKKSSMAIGLFL